MVADLRRVRKRLSNSAPASAAVTRSPAVNAQVNDKVAAVDEAIVTFEQGLVNGLRNLGWLHTDSTQDLQDLDASDQDDGSIRSPERTARFLQSSLSACREITRGFHQSVTIVDTSRNIRQQIPSAGVSVRAGHVLILPRACGEKRALHLLLPRAITSVTNFTQNSHSSFPYDQGSIRTRTCFPFENFRTGCGWTICFRRATRAGTRAWHVARLSSCSNGLRILRR